jgi:hypothetical protein
VSPRTKRSSSSIISIRSENMTSTLSLVTSCLAKCSPDVASLSWLVVNVVLMAWSLHVAVYKIWTSSGNEDVNNVIADDDIPESGYATLEYLVWSLVTTIVWLVEVTLRASFQAAMATISTPQDGDEIPKKFNTKHERFGLCTEDNRRSATPTITGRR